MLPFSETSLASTKVNSPSTPSYTSTQTQGATTEPSHRTSDQHEKISLTTMEEHQSTEGYHYNLAFETGHVLHEAIHRPHFYISYPLVPPT